MIDAMVANILRVKIPAGLVRESVHRPVELPRSATSMRWTRPAEAALQSVVLLKNDHDAAVVGRAADSVAVIGPMADAPYEQLGTWIFDGDAAQRHAAAGDSTAWSADVDIRYVRAMETSRSRRNDAFDEAVEIARDSDVGVLFLGEESILSGEAHSRADINLPGDQAELVRRVREAGKPVVAVIMAGRPLTLTNIVDQVDAILFAWHPGNDGRAGDRRPVVRHRVAVGQAAGDVPAHGRPDSDLLQPEEHRQAAVARHDRAHRRHRPHAPQTSLGMTAFHLDAGYTPLFAFGHGLSYAEFEYRNISTSAPRSASETRCSVSAELTNTGEVAADEVAQLYVRDLVGNVTRPVKELKGFKRVRLEPGQTVVVDFELHTDDLAFYGRNMQLVTEPGEFHVWIGGSSETELRTEFRIVDSD